jgi:hypothetical protein
MGEWLRFVEFFKESLVMNASLKAERRVGAARQRYVPRLEGEVALFKTMVELSTLMTKSAGHCRRRGSHVDAVSNGERWHGCLVYRGTWPIDTTTTSTLAPSNRKKPGIRKGAEQSGRGALADALRSPAKLEKRRGKTRT